MHMRFLRRIGRMVTTERVLWFLAVSVAAVVFFEVGRAFPRMEPYAPDLSALPESSGQGEPSVPITQPDGWSVSGESVPSSPSSDPSTTPRVSETPSSASTATPPAGETGGMLDLNTATKEQLKTINGIGDAFAERIIAYRDSHGGFQSVEELKNISGIGEKRYAQWSPYFTVS